MINTLTGTIIPDDSGAGFITLEVGNVGYMVHVVARTDISFKAPDM
jgi:Holliday junction resolvasome RuvABC DNA-binding subunit